MTTDETFYREVILPTEHSDELRQDGWSYGGDVDSTDHAQRWAREALENDLGEGWAWTR